MAYLINRPTATEFQSTSQPVIQGNFNSADNSFGIDHYKFSDTTPNNGFHNQVTTPIIVGSAHPATTTNPIFYAMTSQGTGPITLQFSRGASNAVPTPITALQSPSTPLNLPSPGLLNILDFATVSGVCLAEIFFVSQDGNKAYLNGLISWNSTGPVANTKIFNVSSGSGLTLQFSSTQLAIVNLGGFTSYTNCFWTMRFLRMGP